MTFHNQNRLMGTAVVFMFIMYLLIMAGPAYTQSSNAGNTPVPVEIMIIKTTDLPVVVESVGRLYPDREVRLSAEISGIIRSYEADVGDPVTKDQILARIDQTDYALALDAAKADLSAAAVRFSAAEKAYTRFKTLLPRKVISQDNFDKVEAEFEAARSQKEQAGAGVAIARERLGKTMIRAPFDGVVASRDIEVGQWIAPGSPVMTILDLQRIRMKVYLVERDFVDVDRDDPVEIVVDAYPDRPFDGTIGRLDVEADPLTNTFGVEVLLNNRDRALKAGMSARAFLTTRVLTDVILIPQDVILFKEQGTEVFLVGEKERVRSQRITLGEPREGLIQVTDGLRAGDRLVVKGQNYLRPDSPVTVTSSRN